MVTRLASLTLAASLLSSAGCSMFGDSSSSNGGLFGRWRHHQGTTADCCCDPCATCPSTGCGVVAQLPPSDSGPILTSPPPMMSAPPMTGAPPMTMAPPMPTAPPPRLAPIPQATPVPYNP